MGKVCLCWRMFYLLGKVQAMMHYGHVSANISDLLIRKKDYVMIHCFSCSEYYAEQSLTNFRLRTCLSLVSKRIYSCEVFWLLTRCPGLFTVSGRSQRYTIYYKKTIHKAVPYYNSCNIPLCGKYSMVTWSQSEVRTISCNICTTRGSAPPLEAVVSRATIKTLTAFVVEVIFLSNPCGWMSKGVLWP